MDICESKKIQTVINNSASRDVDASTRSNSYEGTISMITYLYHKRHRITGLNYFGKTIRDPYKYKGSGLYWKRHLTQHGNQVDTIQVWAFNNLEECKNFAIEFSVTHNIVESKDWANFVVENGIDGQSPGFKNISLSEYNKAHNKDRKNKPGYIPNRLDKKDTEETIAKKRKSHLGKKHGPMSAERYQQHLNMIQETNNSRSNNLKGTKNPMFGKLVSGETRDKLRKQTSGKFWWHNNVTSTMAKESPGPDWVRGRLQK